MTSRKPYPRSMKTMNKIIEMSSNNSGSLNLSKERSLRMKARRSSSRKKLSIAK